MKRQTVTSGMPWNTMLGLGQQLKHDLRYRDYLLVTMGCYFGLRIGDLLSVRWQDVIDKDDFVIQEQKTGKHRKITMSNKVKQAIEWGYKGQMLDDTSTYVFVNRWGGKLTVSYINKRLKVIFRKYQISVQNPSSHTLRKTFGKRVYESDNKSERALVYLSEIFSHASIGTTRRYIGITQEQIADVYMNL